MQDNAFVPETLDAARKLKAAGRPVTREAIARIFGITREAASFRLKRLHDLGLWPRNKISARPAQISVTASEARVRLEAVRAAAREKGRPLNHEELVQALGD
jgi:DNA-binding Lrp family transcriptional regulator